MVLVSPAVLAQEAWLHKGNLPLPDLTSGSTKSELNSQPIELMRFLRERAYPFMQSNLSLRSAVDTAYVYNKFMQAQRYCLPIVLLILGDRKEFDRYVEDCLNMLVYSEERKLYEEYISQLLEHFSDLSVSP